LMCSRYPNKGNFAFDVTSNVAKYYVVLK
jgi:hypothetical protein